MKINYNDWFYKQYGYHTGNRKGKETYNDTKWMDINRRYKTLLNENSKLLDEQPFGVMGNNAGFDKLIDLMSNSNYSFQDINDSLIKTYEYSLKNAMGSMLVNTHAIMFHTTNIDKSNVVSDRFSHYYIIDAPFNQLHFGDRDEFIRNKLQLMYSVETEQYVPMSEFITSEISKILGFTIICTINGYICNDCKIALSDKGFKFKVGWPYSSDVNFIIYKFDESMVYSTTIDAKYISSQVISYSEFPNIDKINLIGKHCIINIYDDNFIKTVPSVVNFGTFTSAGFVISHLQNKTKENIKMNKSTKLHVVIYVINYLHEVPDVYPACNYYDIADSKKVYTDAYNNVDDTDGNAIYSSSTSNVNALERCTPPISLDRNSDLSFKTITDCLNLYTNLKKFASVFKSIGQLMSMSSITQIQFVNRVIIPINNIYDELSSYYLMYLKGNVITSLIPSSLIEKFDNIIVSLNKLRNSSDPSSASEFMIDEFYGDNYLYSIKEITSPFTDGNLSNFKDLSSINVNYFSDESYKRYTRPISEQCFIALRYNRIDNCWLFDYPTIKHFKGISNTFYVNDDLNGTELFKFFVLYTDTKRPNKDAYNVEPLTFDQVFDFDKFNDEVSKHLGYIKYFEAENKLMKICKIVYNKYDNDTCVQVLSKILKNKIDYQTLLTEYPSEIDYEASSITSNNVNNYNDDSEYAPFAINFMFYTLNMLNGNNDKLQTYFMSTLTNEKYNNRYSDINIAKILNDVPSFPINYSEFATIPNAINTIKSKLHTGSKSYPYYGLPLIIGADGNINSINPYRYTFNIYDNSHKYPLLINNGYDKELSKYVSYDGDASIPGYQVYSYHYDIYACKLMTFYISAIDEYISDLQTNYTISFNQTSVLNSFLKTIASHITNILEFLKTESLHFSNPNSQSICDTITTDNLLVNHINNTIVILNNILNVRHNGKTISVFSFFEMIISSLQYVYVTSGFDLYADKRIRKFYLDLKKINSTMSIYQYKKWLVNFDSSLLQILDQLLAENENYDAGSDIFLSYWNSFSTYMINVFNNIDELSQNINDLSVGIYDNHIKPIIDHCEDIIKNYIFDLFIIKNINFDMNTQYDVAPYLMRITLDIDNHLYPKTIDAIPTGSITLLFQLSSDKISSATNKFIIKSISKICEYSIFASDDITCTGDILDIDGNVISSQINCTLVFNKIGTTADSTKTFDQIMNNTNKLVKFENIHESYNINSDQSIISKASYDMNYELMLGNNFKPLNHIHEYENNDKSELQGPVDKISLNTQELNNFVNNEYSMHSSREMYFFPYQVMHIKSNTDGSITSVGGKYFNGQTLYVSTTDGLTTFPIIVNCINHDMSKGFIEANIDSKNTKWFKIDDEENIIKYLTNKDGIECQVLPDNICNFIDEFSNGEYNSYSNALIDSDITYSDENNENAWSLRGDPVYVQNNAPYVYSRVNWMFDESVQNRFMTDDDKQMHFIYIGTGEIASHDDNIQLKMINYNFNHFTDNELYPILREEPNDHSVWDAEIAKFTLEKSNSVIRQSNYTKQLDALLIQYKTETDENVKSELQYQIDSLNYKIQSEIQFQERMSSMILQLEQPTTWFNVHSYEAAQIYISNGRAITYPTLSPNIRDLSYSNKLNVFIYDWENKCWVNPNSYIITTNMIDNVQIDEYDTYNTNRVMYSIIISPNDETFKSSRKLLIYFAYKHSDIFDDITLNDNKFYVKFKPILSLNNFDMKNSNDPYAKLNIRKHLDANESYTISSYNPPSNISLDNSIHITRIPKNGNIVYTPEIRKCDMTISNNNVTYSFDKFDMYTRIPFNDISISSKLKTPKYSVVIHDNIESFIPNQDIQLMCIQNNDNVTYDGNISNVLFDAKTSYVKDSNNNDIQHIDILKSSFKDNNIISGDYLCSICQCNEYKMYGSLITVTISFDDTSVVNGEWIKIPDSLSVYHEIPNDVIFVPHEDVTIDTKKDIIVNFNNNYVKNYTDTVLSNNNNLYNKFEYYYNAKNDVRYPISNIKINNNKQRLTIDTSLNSNIKLIKSTFISICRYSLQNIPRNGIIDLTGYIPTPLNRNRYEFWVNGRFINNSENLIILSPTTIQLINLKSLKNFELIELVDDVNDSSLMNYGNIYIDLNGNMYNTFTQAIISNQTIINQQIRFAYNTSQNEKLSIQTRDIIPNPNNYDIEEDILKNIITTSDDADATDYNNLYNIPTINGIQLRHNKISTLGFIDIPNEDILHLLDIIWKDEEIGNPLFPMTHRENLSLINDQYLKLHCYAIDDKFKIYTTGSTTKYFTLYISLTSDGKIDDIVNTKKIIPFIRSGVSILIGKEYHGMWIHSTQNNCKPIRIN